ncbi:FadR/GntR family transcriptional regulator [Salinicola salarius]|uniref:FadR/GntR family transcriptional regulator n=1 Tax=Salinicola salarius TaxID=430457 RepID=UPI001C4F6CEE|nr:FadR/GntR family transcriptional regulator [Salinicola salarius]
MMNNVPSSTIARGHSLSDEVAMRIRKSIESGSIEPGKRLPTEQELGEAYGVSRPVIREAVSILKSDGLVISQQGRGHFVNPQGASVFRLEPSFEDKEDLADLFHFLMSVEVAATEQAATRRTSSDLDAIRQQLDGLEVAIRENRNGVEEDIKFHRAILQATHNAYFICFGEFLDSRVRNLIRTARENTARNQDMIKRVQHEHEAIFKAIVAQDAEGARAAAKQHLNNAAQRLHIYLAPAD